MDEKIASDVKITSDLVIDPNPDVVFYIGAEEAVKITPKGFYIKGVRVEDTKEGYQKFYDMFKKLLEGLTMENERLGKEIQRLEQEAQ